MAKQRKMENLMGAIVKSRKKLMRFAGKKSNGKYQMKHSILLIAQIAMFTFFFAVNPANAQSFWDPARLHASPGSGGSGPWDSSAPDWWVSGSTDEPWTSSNTATFEGSAGNITLGNGVREPLNKAKFWIFDIRRR